MLFKARRRDPAVVFASDPQFAGKDLRKLPLLQRKNLLQEALQSAPANARIRPVQWIGEEGTRCTTLPARCSLRASWRSVVDSPYRAGRSKDWLKIRTPHGRHVQAERSEKWGG